MCHNPVHQSEEVAMLKTYTEIIGFCVPLIKVKEACVKTSDSF